MSVVLGVPVLQGRVACMTTLLARSSGSGHRELGRMRTSMGEWEKEKRVFMTPLAVAGQ